MACELLASDQTGTKQLPAFSLLAESKKSSKVTMLRLTVVYRTLNDYRSEKLTFEVNLKLQ